MTLHKTWTYEVQGRGDFPVDMLRYDRSFPAREGDALLLTKCVRHPDYDQPSVIRLRHKGDKDWRPARDRWASFGWTVMPTLNE